MWVEVVLLGLAVGVLVGLMGIGGGVVLVPALVYAASMNQHLAQGTSLLVLLPPTGLGALYLYWKNYQVDWRAGVVCAVGILLGGYLGSRFAIGIASNHLRGMFGIFLMAAAALVWRRSIRPQQARRFES